MRCSCPCTNISTLSQQKEAPCARCCITSTKSFPLGQVTGSNSAPAVEAIDQESKVTGYFKVI